MSDDTTDDQKPATLEIDFDEVMRTMQEAMAEAAGASAAARRPGTVLRAPGALDLPDAITHLMRWWGAYNHPPVAPFEPGQLIVPRMHLTTLRSAAHSPFLFLSYLDKPMVLAEHLSMFSGKAEHLFSNLGGEVIDARALTAVQDEGRPRALVVPIHSRMFRAVEPGEDIEAALRSIHDL